MATASTLPYGRPKKHVYGKANRSTWSTTFFDNSDDDLAGPATPPVARTTAQRAPSVNASYPVQKTEVKKAPSPKVAKAKKAKQDTFDVPSSDDDTSPPTKVLRKPAFRPASALVDDRLETKSQLASWERPKNNATDNSFAAKGEQRQTSATAPAEHGRSARSTSHNTSGAGRSQHTQTAEKSPPAATNYVGKLSSAAARLAARKRGAEPVAPSIDEVVKSASYGRTVTRATTEETPRKRAKTSIIAQEADEDVVMADNAALPVCDNTPVNGDADLGVFDFPDSSADESSKPKQRTRITKVTKSQAWRGESGSSSARITPRKGISAPARLAEMLPTDSDVTETSTVSPGASTSRGGTPQRPSTPQSNKIPNPDSVIRSGGNITPKQAQLWNKLLPSQPVAPSPSALAMKELTISGQGKTRSTAARTVVKAQSDVGRRRTRMVDRLKASAQSSSDESDDSSDESEDVEMVEESTLAPTKPPLLRSESTQSRLDNSQSQSQSQSRSQSGTLTVAGLKRTYASQRSHLAEDNPEDDLMAGLIDNTPKQPVARPKTFAHQQSNNKKDAFDLDDSDDDAAGTGAIRNIHELRAAGRNIRGTEDIEQMLEDIENQSPAHKSRRRSALIELATKLADKNFAGRFIGQGCDVRLGRLCKGSADDVANFVLAAAVALLLASDPPEHTLRTLQESDVASWLGSLLQSTNEISKTAKDRRNNMAKASQASVNQLAAFVQRQQALWGDEQPTTMSTRLIALKGLDLLVSKVRRLGDKTEVLPADKLMLVLAAELPSTNPELDVSIAISVLESLSTAALTLAWNAGVLHRIAIKLTSFDAQTPRQQHTFFLTLRLCLNLTTDNARNCNATGGEIAATVPYLLQTALSGFAALESTETAQDQHSMADITLTNTDPHRALNLDLLVLALGILINLFEHSDAARAHSRHSDLIPSLLEVFKLGQTRTANAESVEQTISNVAFGYLAVMLANLCQDSGARTVVKDGLPGKKLSVLGDAVEEFVGLHRRVDGMAALAGSGIDQTTFDFEGEEGGVVWGAFTEKLMKVLERIRGLEAAES